jgi:RHS repeat-associated protein
MQTDTHYTYNPAGAITSIANTPLDQPADTQCFRYDYLQRLTEAWTPASAPCSTDPATTGLGGPARYWQSFTYDKSGNRTTDTQHNAAGDVTRRYSYAAPGTLKPHILNSVTSSGSTQFTYDAVGNTKTRSGATAQQTLDWDAENRLDTVTEGSSKTSFLYDADGGRLIRRDPAGTTLYLGDQEVRVDKLSGTATTTRYYRHGGATVAVRAGGKLSWLADDHQGTTQIAIDTTDLTVQQRRQTPFGTPRGTNGELPGERGFVGGTIDQATGLTHLGARDYDADLGRFTSLDPILNPADPQQINGYSYANNSPINFSDPSGLIVRMDGYSAWIGSAAISSMSPAKAAQAKNYNAGVKRAWSRTPVERKRTEREELLATPAIKNGLSKEKFEIFRSLGYKGSSAFTWQEATDFANQSPVGKSTVCDALGGPLDECVLGGKLTGVLGLIYDVFLADIPECSTGQAEACVGVAASVVPGGGMGKLGKAAEEAAIAGKVAAESGKWSTRTERAGDLAGKYRPGQATRDPASQWYHEELSNEELLRGINGVAEGEGIVVSRNGTILGGHHRWDEVQRRIADGSLDPNTPIRIDIYGGE